LAFDIASQFNQRIEDIFLPEKKSNTEESE
jgi:DNA-binding XRE family transcriptional regulator